MSADELRKAAEHIRADRHEAILFDDMRRVPDGQVRVYSNDGSRLYAGQPCYQVAPNQLVWAAIADWLEWTFDQGHSGDMDDNGCAECRPALTVARLILGGAS